MKALQIGDVMKLTGLSQTTILRMVKTGKLVCWYTPGGHTRYSVQEVVAFMKRYGVPVDYDYLEQHLAAPVQ